MPLPSLLAATATISRPRRRVVSPAGGKVAILGLAMEHQQQDFWCWAAVAVSVRKFYEPSDTTPQCEQANRQLGLTTCCSDFAPCNKPWWLDQNVFRFVGPRALSFAEVQQQIDNRRIVAVHITWNGGGAHFVCIDGYNSAGTIPMLSIRDPLNGQTLMPYDTFLTSYLGIGRWDESHLS